MEKENEEIEDETDKSSCYIVVITTYEDDYKHRYDNGVYQRSPKVFSSETKAKEYTCDIVCGIIEEHLAGHEEGKPDKYIKNIRSDCGTEIRIKKKYRNCYNLLEFLRDKYMETQFIDDAINWTITKAIIDDC